MKIANFIKTHLDFKGKEKLFDNENENIVVLGYERYGVFAKEARTYQRKFLKNSDDDAIMELMMAALSHNLMMEVFHNFLIDEIMDQNMKSVICVEDA